MAITFSLGVACKKEVNEPIKKENIKIEKKANDSEPPVVVIGGENTYPHNTGACYCGQYASCHPTAPQTHTQTCLENTGELACVNFRCRGVR